MSTEVTVALIVAGGGALTVLGNYLVGKRHAQVEERKTSGSIQTSEAVDLWAESNALRQEYKERAEKLEDRLEEVNSQLQEVLTQLTNLQGKSDKMITKIDELKKVIASLRAENARLLAERRKGKSA